MNPSNLSDCINTVAALSAIYKHGAATDKERFRRSFTDKDIDKYWNDGVEINTPEDAFRMIISAVVHFNNTDRLEKQNVSMNGLRTNLTREINTLTRALDDHATYEETVMEALRDVQDSVSILNVVYDAELPGIFDELDIEVVHTPYDEEEDQ